MDSYKAKCHVCGERKDIIDRATTAGGPVCEECRDTLIEGKDQAARP